MLQYDAVENSFAILELISGLYPLYSAIIPSPSRAGRNSLYEITFGGCKSK